MRWSKFKRIVDEWVKENPDDRDPQISWIDITYPYKEEDLRISHDTETNLFTITNGY